MVRSGGDMAGHGGTGDDINILERRLQAEAERRALTVEAARSLMLELGLDAAQDQRQRDKRAAELSADILLVTATMTEHRELRDAAKKLRLPFETRRGRLATYYHLGRVGENRVASIQVTMGAFGAAGSAAGCIQARAETQATTLILLGTAFGVDPAQQRVGDVLVSEFVFLYDDRHAVDDASAPGYAVRYPASARRPASATWVERFQRTANLFKQSSEPERVMVGTLLSGGSRVESARYRDELVANIPASNSPVVGGEMEAAGAVSAFPDTSADEPGWVVVKGIADFADAQSRAAIETGRVAAARSSAKVVLQTLQRPASLA